MFSVGREVQREEYQINYQEPKNSSPVHHPLYGVKSRCHLHCGGAGVITSPYLHLEQNPSLVLSVAFCSVALCPQQLKWD